MSVTAIVVTRGDVPLDRIWASLPADWQKITWDNGRGVMTTQADGITASMYVSDVGVYGRYAAVEHALHDVIYVQDDDVIVSDPQAITAAWSAQPVEAFEAGYRWHAVCNMPQEFRHDFYREHALVGFGAAFHRVAPKRAFDRMAWRIGMDVGDQEWFNRTCDVVFTALTPHIFVDIPKTNLPWAEAPNRMYRNPSHVGERKAMLEAALACR